MKSGFYPLGLADEENRAIYFPALYAEMFYWNRKRMREGFWMVRTILMIIGAIVVIGAVINFVF